MTVKNYCTFLLATIAFLVTSHAKLTAQSVLSKAVRVSENKEPAVPHPEQEEEVQKKLRALANRTGCRPNIVWLLIDDMGWGEPGCYGGGEVIGAATPNLDRLASSGLKLTSCYSQPTCTPTRSAMLTGRLPARTGLTRPIVAGDRLTKNPWADEVSLPRLLSDAGYTTVLCGKWHVGEVEGMKPFEVGFDEFYGFYPAQKELSQAIDERRYPDLVLDPDRMSAYHKLGMSHALVRGIKGAKEEVVQEMKSLDDIAEGDRLLKEYTLKKISEFSVQKKPFFLQHSFMKVHADNFAAKDFKGKSKSKYPYKDAVVEVDAIIGDIVNELDNKNLLENTFIFVTSDNGPQMDSWPDSGYSPWRGAKGSCWEGGVRVPGIAFWKGIIPARTSDDLFDLMDLFNTSLTLAGIPGMAPKDRYIDSIDQTSFLLADAGRSNRDKVYFWDDKNFMAMRMFEYKLHLKVVETEGQFLDIDMSSTKDVLWLFNLFIDPKESYAIGHRQSAWLATLGSEIKEHMKTFVNFPPKSVGLDRK
jgi:arylsulfatase A-like enzyme